MSDVTRRDALKLAAAAGLAAVVSSAAPAAGQEQPAPPAAGQEQPPPPAADQERGEPSAATAPRYAYGNNGIWEYDDHGYRTWWWMSCDERARPGDERERCGDTGYWRIHSNAMVPPRPGQPNPYSWGWCLRLPGNPKGWRVELKPGIRIRTSYGPGGEGNPEEGVYLLRKTEAVPMARGRAGETVIERTQTRERIIQPRRPAPRTPPPRTPEPRTPEPRPE